MNKLNASLAKWSVGSVLLVCIGAGVLIFSARATPPPRSETGQKIIARGAGITVLTGGTGGIGGFVPVLTTIAFHAEKDGDNVTGEFECLARTPEARTGPASAQFTVNFMYVTGRVTGAEVHGKTVTLTGVSTCTGFGAGSDVAFTFVAQGGGPGATGNLTVSTLPGVEFKEILNEGVFEVF